MPKPFKNLFSVALIEQMGRCFAALSPEVDMQKFVALASSALDTVELKERNEQLKQAMTVTLDSDFEVNCNVLIKRLKPVTIRKYYAGEHYVALKINGVEQAQLPLELV